MAVVEPGELKYRITVIKPRRQVDGNAHYAATDEELLTCWAAKRSGSGSDQLVDGADRSVDTVQFIVRWGVRGRISRDCAILHRGVRYDILWMDEAPWAGGYARIRAVSWDQGEV